MNKSTSRRIEPLISKEDWPAARKLIQEELRRDPDDHWLLDRLSLTYYEERNYAKALEYIEQARQLAPDCPLVLWDYAGTLDMLGRKQEALKVYKRLMTRGLRARAVDECWEGPRWTRSLVNDCRYRIALVYRDMGKPALALRYLKAYLRERGPATPSIYRLKEVKDRLAQLEACA
jgi:tetratricopeptide (TPR) repeat protein